MQTGAPVLAPTGTDPWSTLTGPASRFDMAAIAEVPISLAGDNAKIAEFAKQLTADGEHGAPMEAEVAGTAGGWAAGAGLVASNVATQQGQDSGSMYAAAPSGCYARLRQLGTSHHRWPGCPRVAYAGDAVCMAATGGSYLWMEQLAVLSSPRRGGGVESHSRPLDATDYCQPCPPPTPVACLCVHNP